MPRGAPRPSGPSPEAVAERPAAQIQRGAAAAPGGRWSLAKRGLAFFLFVMLVALRSKLPWYIGTPIYLALLWQFAGWLSGEVQLT